MIKKKLYFLFVILLTASFFGCSVYRNTQKQLIAENFSVAAQQYDKMLEVATDLTKYPRGSAKDGTLRYVGINDWTGGFWPGILWYMFEYTGDAKWRATAEKWTASLESNQFNTSHHDIGFMMYDSYGNGYRLTHNEAYKPILIQSAKSLMKRYSPVAGSIQSWNKKKSVGGKNTWEFPVIIDNMMNLELLFFASKITGDNSYRDAAIKHAETTMKNHVRPDYSSYHVVSYDPATGAVKYRQAAQGFSDNSTWARGQSWGIYGFTVAYRETKDKRFLQTAQGMADFFLNHKKLPSDKVPLWDFNVGEAGYVPDWKFDPNQYQPIPRDASAAAITSSALLELSKYVDEAHAKTYKQAAIAMIQSLSSPAYRAEPGSNNYFMLKNSVGSFPANAEVNSPLVYADYYFLEALLRLKKLQD
ncbi:MAG: glucuronyl hydrolase [Sphingobacteriaceae bacterium]|jgi:chondroitin AC lyase|nr:glucuronyl hydrolase [Sphingobacteriaceae bacterium]